MSIESSLQLSNGCSGSLVVMKANRKNNNLYRYRGSTVIGTATFSEDKEAKATRLWHMRLRHARGKSLKTLSDQGLLKGAPVSWKSTLQSTVALSTTEAKYMTITEDVKEAIWLQGLLKELGVEQKDITIFCDSQSVIQLAKNQVYHARTKHITTSAPEHTLDCQKHKEVTPI
ncbi:uncharacterized protein [Nicotiana sylvestris]|uniref:uncharacterized protein n=1 Tax=Nicotiana sylvestris TaxID=4096 RepID=UPI00388C6DDF